MKILPTLAAFAAAVAPIAAAADVSPQQADAAIRKIVASPRFKQAAAALDAGHEKWVADTITLTEIPSPPFKEAARAKAYAEMFRGRGLSDVQIDQAGNVLGLRKGNGGGPVLIVSAHLDTVFPEGTAVKVRREGDTLHAPGVGDDSSGLATQLALIDALNAAGIATQSDILFVGTVGEEGLGDLRGVRHLFNKGGYKGRAKAFISLDGGGMASMVTGGVGSKRYRVTFKGPGGHSYGAFGLVNPMGALAGAVAELYAIKVPDSPKTTYSASVVGGGTSVNAIPEEVWLEVDMRSESAAELDKVETAFLAGVERAVAAENGARATREGKITADLKPIGDRPAGRTSENADIVRFATAAWKAEGLTLALDAASTDANLPMSLDIPAVTLSRVSRGARAHAPDEWIGIEKADNVQVKRMALATILAITGVR